MLRERTPLGPEDDLAEEDDAVGGEVAEKSRGQLQVATETLEQGSQEAEEPHR